MIFTISFSFQDVLGDYEMWFPDIVFATVSILYLLVFFSKIVFSEWTDKLRKFAFLPLVLFPIVWLIMSPLGLSFWGEKRVNSYVVGGWSKMMLAGGPVALQNDSVYLLEYTNNPEPDWQDLPSAIKKLDGWVEIDFEKQLVLVGTGSMFNMANEFGFIIREKNGALPIPDYLAGSDFYRIWRLADGVYFFSR